MTRAPVSLAVILLLGAAAHAQDVASGPDPGKAVPPLRVFVATGPLRDKDVDYAAERKDRPTVYLLVQADKFGRPMARFMRKLDQEMQRIGDGPHVVAVWLTDAVEKTKEYLPRAQQSVRFERTALTCFAGAKVGPKDWNANADADLTAVVANRGQVVTVFGYRSINETDAPRVLEALKKAMGKD